jgi:protein CpxP
MKKVLISMIALLLLIGGAVNAQNAGGGQQMDPAARAKMQAENVKTILTLTDEQTAKVTAILLGVRKQQDSLRAANPDADRTVLMEKMTAFNAARDAKVKALLTPAQVTIFDAKKAEIFPARGGRPQQAPAQ